MKAVVAFSPPCVMKGFIPPDAWSTMTVPVLVETGTADMLPGFIDDWRAHRASFDAAPSGHKWLIVGDNVDHYFGGLICRLSGRDPSQVAALDATVKISLNFLDAYGRGDAPALSRLNDLGRTEALAPLLTLTAG